MVKELKLNLETLGTDGFQPEINEMLKAGHGVFFNNGDRSPEEFFEKNRVEVNNLEFIELYTTVLHIAQPNTQDEFYERCLPFCIRSLAVMQTVFVEENAKLKGINDKLSQDEKNRVDMDFLSGKDIMKDALIKFAEISFFKSKGGEKNLNAADWREYLKVEFLLERVLWTVSTSFMLKDGSAPFNSLNPEYDISKRLQELVVRLSDFSGNDNTKEEIASTFFLKTFPISGLLTISRNTDNETVDLVDELLTTYFVYKDAETPDKEQWKTVLLNRIATADDNQQLEELCVYIKSKMV